jgi:hypothetical protein
VGAGVPSLCDVVIRGAQAEEDAERQKRQEDEVFNAASAEAKALGRRMQVRAKDCRIVM